MTRISRRWRAAILWFIASAASIAAAVVTYAETGAVRWLLVAAGGLMAAVGFSTLRRSGSGDA